MKRRDFFKSLGLAAGSVVGSSTLKPENEPKQIAPSVLARKSYVTTLRGHDPALIRHGLNSLSISALANTPDNKQRGVAVQVIDRNSAWLSVQKGWFRKKDTVYSIVIFDALKMTGFTDKI